MCADKLTCSLQYFAPEPGAEQKRSLFSIKARGATTGGVGGVRTPPQILLGPLQLFWTTFFMGVQSWWGPPSAGNCVALRRLEVRLRLRVTLRYVAA